MTDDRRSVTVTLGVVTFRRPDDLAALLPLLLEHATAAEADPPAGTHVEVDVVVVDNDPAGSARPVVTSLGSPRIRYAVESAPGIATARNRVLDEVAARDLLVFIDDDERPHAGWLRALLETHARHRATGVAGAVVSAFDAELDDWVRAGDFFRRRRLPTGTAIDVAATNNLLLDLAAVRRAGVRFDPDFGLSGGSDTLFTRQLAAAGGRLVWCDEAVVTDRVPAGRTSREWVLRRAYRSGNSAGRVELVLAATATRRAGARLRAARSGLPRLLGGAARWVLGQLTGSAPHQAHGLRTAARGAGMVSAAVGVVYQEYRRPASA
jgi:GT2 family glycosyltransferase